MNRNLIGPLALSALAGLYPSAHAVISPIEERPLASCDAAVHAEIAGARIVDTFHRRSADGGHEVYLNLQQFERGSMVLRRATCRTGSSGHRVEDLRIENGRWIEARPD